MELKAVRGMHDLFGEELARWVHVESKLRAVLGAFGYSEMRTPTLEKAEVFKQTVGDDTDIVEKQMYEVSGDDAEKLVLRPEGTASFIRSVIEHQLHRTGHPQRFYYYLPMYRHERPQKGRLRQFHQFGAELINDPSPEADAEIITLLDHSFRTLGIHEYEVRVNSVGCSDCRPAYKETLKAYFRPSLGSLCELCQKRFERAPLRILDCKKEECKVIAEKAPRVLDNLCAPCHTHHATMKDRLADGGVAFIEDSGIVRGLDYYCRTAFEFTSNLLGAQSALGGGGRYDGISTRFGEKPFPGVGYALGMERLMIALEARQSWQKAAAKPDFYFAPLGEEAYRRLFRLSLELKRQGTWAEMSYEKEKGFKWQLKQADRTGARFTLLVGEDELKQNKAALKDMKAGTQELVDWNGIEQTLVRRAQSALQAN